MDTLEWSIYTTAIFRIYLNTLQSDVSRIRENNPTTYKEHCKTKLLVNLFDAINELKKDPTKKEYHQGNTLGADHRDWKRIKKGLPQRYRVFFKYISTPPPRIVIAWMNDERTLRKDGAKNDCYRIFKKMLDNRKINSNFDNLIDNGMRFIA